jgi:hypothetical protein
MRPRNAVLPFLLLFIAGTNVPLQASSGIYQQNAHTLFYLPLDGPDAGKGEGCSIIDPNGVLSYIPDRFGNPDAAIHVAGTGSASDDFYISCQNTKIGGSSSPDFTVGYWVRTNQPFPPGGDCGNPHGLCDYRNFTVLASDNNSGCYKYLTAEVGAGSTEGAWPRACGSNNGIVVSTLSIADGNWHNLLWVFDYTNKVGTFYLDGVQNSQGQLPNPPVSAQNSQAVAGAENGVFALDGDMDDLWVEDHAWSAAEVTQYFSSSGFPFLSFPLMNKGAFTALINSVFDHSMYVGQGKKKQWGYCPDEVVTAYTGETGMFPYDSSYVGDKFTCPFHKPPKHVKLYGWAQDQNGTPFSVNGQYWGSGNTKYLYYDGHPGFDYVTTDQNQDGSLCGKPGCSNSSGRTPVLAADLGTVVCIDGEQPCSTGLGEIRIDHGNGYFTVYLHLSKIAVLQNDHVSTGQKIGVSGDKGAETGGPHLHFEVRKGQSGSGCSDKNACVPVDPYGYTGPPPDP